MAHANATIQPLEDKKRPNKLTGFHVRILDDGSYVMKTENTDYSKCMEYSYSNMDELHSGMKKVMGKMDKSESKDELGKKY